MRSLRGYTVFRDQYKDMRELSINFRILMASSAFGFKIYAANEIYYSYNGCARTYYMYKGYLVILPDHLIGIQSENIYEQMKNFSVRSGLIS